MAHLEISDAGGAAKIRYMGQRMFNRYGGSEPLTTEATSILSRA